MMTSFFVSSSFVLVLLCLLLEFGNTRPQHFVGVGNRFFIVHKPTQTQKASHDSSMPIMLAKASTGPASSGQIYVLRRKTPNQSNQPQQSMITNEHSTNLYQQNTPTASFSFPILSSGQNQNRRTMDTLSTASNSNRKSMHNAYNQESRSSRPGTVFGTDPPAISGIVGSSTNDFRSNIPLPTNPFMPIPSISSYGNIMVERSDTPVKNYANSHTPPELPVAEEGLQNMLNKYLEDMYRSKSPNVQASTNSAFQQNPFGVFDTSRVDNDYSLYDQNDPKPFSSHYSKTGSSASDLFSQMPYFQEAQSRESVGHVSFTSVLEKIKPTHHLNEVFPPVGSYTPYGERTILMVKYPGLPGTKRVGYNNLHHDYQFGGKKPFSFKDILSPSKNNDKQFPGALEPKPSDFGVVVSQNFILQPTNGFGPSRFQPADDGDSSSPGNLVSQLAKALAERNRIINAYSASPMADGKDVVQKPPFVLVHLESFTKKTNKTGRFGFDDEIDKNYSNGTIIYPTKNNPNVLASTKFEFENIADVVFLFDRPLEGYLNGRMKPIVPLGIEEIKMFLKLVYEVHRDVHDGGKKKVTDLKDISSNTEKQTMVGTKPSNLSHGRFSDNWMHTSSIGLRSLA